MRRGGADTGDERVYAGARDGLTRRWVGWVEAGVRRWERRGGEGPHQDSGLIGPLLIGQLRFAAGAKRSRRVCRGEIGYSDRRGALLPFPLLPLPGSPATLLALQGRRLPASTAAHKRGLNFALAILITRLRASGVQIDGGWGLPMRPVARRGGGVRRRCRGCRHSSHTGGSWRRCSGWLRGCQGDNLRRAQLLCGCVPPRLRVCARGFCHWLRLWALDLRARRRARLHRSVCSLIRRGVGGPGVAATRFLAGARRRRRLDPTLPIVPLPDLAIANLQLGGDLECLRKVRVAWGMGARKGQAMGRVGRRRP